MILEFEGRVDVSRAGTTTWNRASTNQVLAAGDRVRTLEGARAVVLLSNRTRLRLSEFSTIEIRSPAQGGGLHLLRGILYFFHRDKPGVFPVETPSAYAVISGTEFNLAVSDNDTTTVNMIDGRVELTNAFGRVEIASGQSAVAESGQPPRRTAVLEAVNVIEWALYYPGVLDVDELPLTDAEKLALTESLAAYRSGDLPGALASYPAGRQPASDAERVYRAAVALAVGRVQGAEKELNELKGREAGRVRRLGEALRVVVKAVKFPSDWNASSPRASPPLRAGERVPEAAKPREARAHADPFDPDESTETSFATELLAGSYAQQSRGDLKGALALARRAVGVSPKFGFGWARVAELEFGFGQSDNAKEALAKALEFSPRNAQAWALDGFVAAAENRIRAAMGYFDQAIVLDGALGNAWLGRGLCRIRQGESERGREDLEMAVMVEPQRAVLRSYLGLAYGHAHDNPAALNELRLAKEFDPGDPTAWLYSALINRQQNRVNDAVGDLQRSQELNGNRRVYRSRQLLEQDEAVRGVNLANAYMDVRFLELAQREAGRAVDADVANYSAHLFLANSYQGQRDLKGINQRFEAPAISEYLLADLLSPVGAGTLAQTVSQQEYSKLIESDGLGVASSTEYFSNGRWVEQGAQYGTMGNFGYAVSGYYNSDPGQRANNKLEQTEVSLQLKQQLTPKDSVYFRAIFGEAEGGDLAPRYDPESANRTFHFEETQQPLLLAGYHHEWNPGVHSLLLGGWFRDEQLVRNQEHTVPLFGLSTNVVTDVAPVSIEQKYRNEVQGLSLEGQQIWQGERNALIVGVRYQAGDLETHNQHTNAVVPDPLPPILGRLFPNQPENVSSDFSRWSGYAYFYVRPVEPLHVVAGLSYDTLRFPANFRFAPLSGAEKHDEQLSPKAGLVWTPWSRTTVRGGYSKSLGGVGFEQSFRLEPTQVAGFNQVFRSLAPESVTGANVDEPFESFNVSLERQFGAGTFAAVSGELLRSKLNRDIGIYELRGFTVTPGWTRQKLDYHEGALSVTLNQLVGKDWALGALYRVSRAHLETEFSDIPPEARTYAGFVRSSDSRAVLQHVNLSATYHHRSGFFGVFQSLWFAQSNQGDASGLAGANFWQFNVLGGWRFLDRRAEFSVGLLNLASQDYRLNPLNLAPELPRERTLTVGLKLNF